jgi:hypothetical protein
MFPFFQLSGKRFKYNFPIKLNPLKGGGRKTRVPIHFGIAGPPKNKIIFYSCSFFIYDNTNTSGGITKMRRKWKHRKLIFFISIALTFFSFITSSADTTTYQYDDNARKVRIERGTRAYDISGNVTSGGSPIAGATITLSGARSATLTTDSSGNYIFDGLLNGSYALTPGKTGYTFSPTNRNVTINGADITNQNFTGISGAPIPPSNPAAVAVSSSQINLSWTDNSTNETGFKIERKTGAGGSYSQIATVGANVTTYANTGLTAGTTYYYRVRAYNASGDSAYSNEASATTMSGTTTAVRIARTPPVYFSTFQAAYNAAVSGDIIQSQALHFTENLTINRNINVTFDGGYDTSFVSNSGNKTYLKGMITTTVGGGTVTIKNFVIEQ